MADLMTSGYFFCVCHDLPTFSLWIIIWDSLSWLPHQVRKLNSSVLSELLWRGASSSNRSISLHHLTLKLSTNHYLFQQNLNTMAHSSDRNGLEEFLESTNPLKQKARTFLTVLVWNTGSVRGTRYRLPNSRTQETVFDHRTETSSSESSAQQVFCVTVSLQRQRCWTATVSSPVI